MAYVNIKNMANYWSSSLCRSYHKLSLSFGGAGNSKM